MNMNDETCYRALIARDVRFDGVFFVGVSSTGIYCRPICPARTPQRVNCCFFASSAIAERAGFRPCLRCRPELAPGLAPVDAISVTARRAVARIEAGALNGEGSLETLAGELGLSSRQLRRAVRHEFGVSPIELAQTRRLLLAKQLLTETDLPVVRVAYASGFESLRRFNALFVGRYGLTPSRLRKSVSKNSPEGVIRLSLSYRPPYAWDSLLRFLNDRATAGVEMVADGQYRRTVQIGASRGWLSVQPKRGANALLADLSLSLVPVLPTVLARLRHLFDLDARPDVIALHLAGDPWMAELQSRHPGLRAPGAFDGFELAIRVVLGQRISVAAATTLAGRLASQFGEPIETPYPELLRLPLSADRVLAADPAAFVSLGIPLVRGQCIQSVARGFLEGRLELEPGVDPEATMSTLRGCAGIGEWTAQAIALRVLRWPDAFPASDLGLLRASGASSPNELIRTAEAWRTLASLYRVSPLGESSSSLEDRGSPWPRLNLSSLITRSIEPRLAS